MRNAACCIACKGPIIGIWEYLHYEPQYYLNIEHNEHLPTSDRYEYEIEVKKIRLSFFWHDHHENTLGMFCMKCLRDLHYIEVLNRYYQYGKPKDNWKDVICSAENQLNTYYSIGD